MNDEKDRIMKLINLVVDDIWVEYEAACEAGNVELIDRLILEMVSLVGRAAVAKRLRANMN